MYLVGLMFRSNFTMWITNIYSADLDEEYMVQYNTDSIVHCWLGITILTYQLLKLQITIYKQKHVNKTKDGLLNETPDSKSHFPFPCLSSASF